MKKNILFWIYFVVAIILAIYFSTRIIMTFMGIGDVSTVHKVSIKTDSKNKDLTEISAAAAIAPGTHTYSVNLNQIQHRISDVPGVKQVAVRRLPNGNLSVNVKTHKTFASWTDGQFYYPISDDGTIINKPSNERNNNSITFRGNIPSDIKTITKAATNLIDKIDYIEQIEERRWNLQTKNGILVMLPENAPEDAIGKLLVLQKKYKILTKDLTTIDMRDDARILIK